MTGAYRAKMYIKESVFLGGKELSIETGKMAKQSDAAVVIRYGDSMVLVTAVAAKAAREGVDFLSLIHISMPTLSDSNYHATRV